jgi:hypothetical protein
MVISLNKLAPRVIALAAVGYCIWPSLSDLQSDVKPMTLKKVTELSASLFSPKLSPSPTRDPFGGPDAASLASVKKSPAGGNSARSSAGKATDIPADPLGGLRLDATCILGQQRAAVISGQLYASHEKISSGNSSTSPYKVVSVFPYKVLLEHEGKTLELKYSDVAPRSALSRQAGSRAKHGAAAGAPRAKKSQDAATGEDKPSDGAGK